MSENKTGFRIIPPYIILGLIGLATALHFAWGGWPSFRFPWAGWPLIGVGVVLFMWVRRLFLAADTTIRPHENPSALVDNGPFRCSRNPIYLSVVLAMVGLALVVGSLPFYIVPVLFALPIHLHFIPMEEANLEAALGQPYRDYKARVRRWI